MISNNYSQVIESAIKQSLEVRQIQDGWNHQKKGKYFSIYNKKYADYDLKLLKIDGTIPAALTRVQSYFFEDYESQKKNREMCEDLLKIESIDKDTTVTLFKMKSKFVISARETLSIYHRRALSPNEFVIIHGHIDDHPKVPAKKDVIRSQTIIFAMFLTSIDSNTTKAQIFFLNDPKGSIPAMVINGMVDQFLESFENDVASILQQK